MRWLAYLISAGFVTSAALCLHCTPNSFAMTAVLAFASSADTRPCITTSAPASARPLSMPKPMPWVDPANDQLSLL